MIDSGDYDFSFSGLKTAILYLTQDIGSRHPEDERSEDEGSREKPTGSFAPLRFAQDDIRHLCASFQQAVIDVLITKTQKAIKQFNPKTVLCGGGVMANKKLRKTIKDSLNSKSYIPNSKYCTDNAAMIAMAGYFQAKEKDFTPPNKLKSQPNLSLDSHSSARVNGEKK